jgi:microsomal epoxide hydrolase
MLAWPPRSYVDRLYNVTHWSAMTAGGHFAAMEQPDMLVEDVRRFARSLKQESN